MDASSDVQPMTAGELKSRLYQTFRERGLVESLKSQLRTKLVTELRQSANLQNVKSAVISSSLDGSSSLMLRAANSLVSDHLRRCGYDYSVAVFMPESGATEDKLFTVPDLLDLLKIAPGSQLYKRLAAELPRYDSKGFLWQLLTELSSGQAKKQEHVGIQVDSHPINQSSIERKLQSVDDIYKQRSEEDEILNRHAIQEKLLKIKREMEVKSREEISREISRFKESALKRVELEEREKARKEIANARREIENTYQAKSDALTEREHATMDRLHKHQELVEKETYAQRQSLLDELRTIKQREADIRRESEINGRAAKMEEEKRKAMEENLQLREAAVANIERTYENRLKEETKRFELDYESKLSTRLTELEHREAKIRVEQRSMNDEKETLKSLKDQLQGKANHILELENLLKESKAEALLASNRSDLLNERMRTMVDYPALKENNTILKRDLEHAKLRLAELGSEFKGEQSRHEELIKELSEKMSKPSPELQALRSELQQTRDQLSHEKATMQHMEAQWKARLQEEVETSRDLRHRLSEQTNEMTALMRQLADLKLALRQTQTALNNNIYHPERNLGLGIGDTVHNSTLAEDIYMYMDTSLHRTTLGPELLLAESHRYQPPLDESNSGEDSESQEGGDSIAFIEQTKARFRQLEREAEHLESNYQDLQHRMSGIGGSYSSPGIESLFSSSHRPRPTDIEMSRIPDASSHLPVGGSRQVMKDSTHSPPHSKHPRKHSSSHQSKAGKERSDGGRPRLPESGTRKDGSSDQGDTRMSEKHSQSLSSSSSLSSTSRLRTSDLGIPDQKGGALWLSPLVTAGAAAEGEFSQLSDRSAHQAPSHEEKTRVMEEERRRREEEERQRIEAERRRKDDEERRRHEEERRHREEDERRWEEMGRTDADEEERRRRMEEEEEEQRAWEEKRRKKEEERKRKEQEAREREQRMLMELQKHETSTGAGPYGTKTNQPKDSSPGLNDTYELKDDVKKDGREENKKEEEEDGVKIDPVMQRYMMMVQQRKQQQDSTPAAAQEPEVIPDSPSLSHKSDGSISGDDMEGEGLEDPASAGKASDIGDDDPFGDW